jgi:hypothetical protein
MEPELDCVAVPASKMMRLYGPKKLYGSDSAAQIFILLLNFCINLRVLTQI